MVNSNKFILSALVMVIVGCSSGTSEKNKIIPKSEKTTEEIYTEQAGSFNKEQTLRHMISMRQATDEEVLTRPYEYNDVGRPEFKTLPNPTLYLYFPATLSTDGRMPVPAWMTEFKMYDKNEYAAHGEIAIRNDY